jgi:hypothetical protein
MRAHPCTVLRSTPAWFVAVALLLTVVGIDAQQPTPTPLMDGRGFPLPFGVQPYYKPDFPLGSGPCKAIMSVEPVLSAHVVYAPNDLSKLGGRKHEHQLVTRLESRHGLADAFDQLEETFVLVEDGNDEGKLRDLTVERGCPLGGHRVIRPEPRRATHSSNAGPGVIEHSTAPSGVRT